MHTGVFDICISVFDIVYKFKINRPKFLFLWCIFLTKKRVQKGVYRNDGLFLLLDRIESAPDGSHKNENISGASRIESAPDGSLLHYYDLMVKMDERV